jgi:hypothetical protein
MSELLAYDAAGNVIATLGHVVARDDAGEVIGLIDFDAHEAADGKLRDIWDVSGAKGSATWPEWLGGAAYAFTVELDKQNRITALVHKTSSYRRERAAILATIEATPSLRTPAGTDTGTRDIRHLVGGPMRPLALDSDGRTLDRAPLGTPAHLPIIAGGPKLA